MDISASVQDERTPIEIALNIDANGMTTAKKLYSFLQLNPVNYSRWCKSNIVDNVYAEENVDFTPFFTNEECGGQASTDYKISAKLAKSLSMQSKSDRGEQARNYFTKVEEKAKQFVINRNALSPTTKALYGMLDSIASVEIEQKKQAQQIAAIDTKITTMQEIFAEPLGDWKNDINKRVRKIAQALNKDYKDVYTEMYGQLEVEARISLSRRCESKRARMEKAGNTKTTIKEGTTKLAIIYDDQKLRVIFENIVKRWAMRYCA